MQRAEWIDPELRRTRFEYWSELWWSTTVHLRPTTRHGYGGALRARVLPTFQGRRVADIDRAVVRKWIAEMSSAGYAPKSMRQALSVLSMILQLAQESGAMVSNPAQRHRLPRVVRKEPIFLTAAQVETLAASVRAPFGFLIRFAAYTGLRPSELCGLRVGRLDVMRGSVEVAETLIPLHGQLVVGPTKNYARRTVPLPRFLRDDAASHLADRATMLGRPLEPTDYVFGGLRAGPLNRDSLHKLVLQPGVLAAGLPPALRTHDLRHTCASLLIELGAHPKAIQERLGHSDIGVTLNVYGHLFPSLQEALTERLDDVHERALAVPWSPAQTVVRDIAAAAQPATKRESEEHELRVHGG
jgi:integrase